MQGVKKYLIVVHIAGWLLFMAFPLLFLNRGDQTGESLLLLQNKYYWLFCASYIFLFYSNAYFFIPRLFLRRKYGAYAIIALLLFTGIYFLRPFDRLLRNNDHWTNFSGQMLPPPMDHGLPGNHLSPPPGDQRRGDFTPGPPDGPPPFRGQKRSGPGAGGYGGKHHGFFFDTTSFFIFLMIMALSTATKTIRQWELTEQRAARAEADKASAELSFLKAQINPHFLFNTLNNIYTLALIKDDHAPESIMKLSNIMRYVTDDATLDFVPLQSELDCINDYIELQRLRIGSKTEIDISFAGDIAHQKIAPFVLMTFIENVFKYGISKHQSSVIVITVLAAENSILFYCVNTIFLENKPNERAGTGLENTKKRLQSLYPGRHILKISNENSTYTVNLTLQT